MDNKDKRRHPRRPAELNVELTYPSGESRSVKTRDISQGGLFILLDHDNMPPQGGGEPAIINMGGVIATAVHDAAGAKVMQLPMTPERVKAAIEKV